MTQPQEIIERATQADCEAAAKALGYKDYADATDYRLTGAQDREVAAMVQAFAAHRRAAVEHQATLLEEAREALGIVVSGALDISNTAIIVGDGADTVMRQLSAALAKLSNPPTDTEKV